MPESFDRLMARLWSISTVGSLMVAPIGLGLALDYYLGVMPLFAVLGAIFGLAAGIIQLVRFNRTQDR